MISVGITNRSEVAQTGSCHKVINGLSPMMTAQPIEQWPLFVYAKASENGTYEQLIPQ